MNRIIIILIILLLTVLSIAFFVVVLPRLPSIVAETGAEKETVKQIEDMVDNLCGMDLCSISIGLSSNRLPVMSRGFILSSAILMTGVSLAVYYYFKEKLIYYDRIRQQITEFLPIAASLAQTKTTTTEILRIASNMIEDPLRTVLRSMVHLITLGEDPEVAARTVTKGAAVEVRAVFDSIAVGAKSGGRFAEILERANEYFLEVFRMEKSIRTRLGEYKVISVLAGITFIAASIVSIELISSLTTGQATPLFVQELDTRAIESALYITALIVSIVSSLVVGKVIEGNIIKSFKYIAITVLIAGLAFAFYPFFLP
jgi:Flp pilus assembly protein TadB